MLQSHIFHLGKQVHPFRIPDANDIYIAERLRSTQTGKLREGSIFSLSIAHAYLEKAINSCRQDIETAISQQSDKLINFYSQNGHRITAPVLKPPSVTTCQPPPVAQGPNGGFICGATNPSSKICGLPR